MSQKYILLSFFLFVTQWSFSQTTGSIKGTVINKNGNAIAHANITIPNSGMGTESEEDGSFLLQNVPTGNYNLRISYVGFQTNELAVSVQGGAITTVPAIILNNKEQDLEEVVVRANGNINEFARGKTPYVAKLPLKDIENPQVYNTITTELLEEQVVTNFDDAIRNAPGISKLWESTGRGNDGAGYYSLRGFPVQPTLVNGLPGVTNGSPDPANIDRIEVIKGPSGTLYGSSLISYGGLINIVTKKPYDYFGGNISYTIGSFGLNRVTADVNTPLDEAGKVALRVNTAYHKQNSFQDLGFQESFFIAPSLSYTVNDRLSFLVNTEIYTGESTNPTMLFVDRGAPLTATNIEELGYDPNLSYTSNELTLKNPSYSLQGQMNYQLSDNWLSQTVLSRASAKAKGHYTYLYETTRFFKEREEVEGSVTNLDEGLVFTRYMNHQNSTTLTSDIQQNFIGEFTVAGMRNRMVIGLDYYNRKVIDNSSGYIANGNVYIGDASLQNVNESVYGIFDPSAYIRDNDNGILSVAAANNLLANSQLNNNTVEEDVYSAYVSNVINFTPKISAMASLRVDRFENNSHSQTTLSPKFGIVYQPVLERVSLFGNYMDGFRNIAPGQEGNPAEGQTRTVTFEPERARQLEVGTKLNLIRNKIAATISYYDIQVSNMVMEETGRPFFYVQDGERYSRGLEASITATPFEGLNIIAGYSHNDSKLTVSDQTDFLGRRPESAGPKNLANLWASYKFHEGTLEGFGFGLGGNYASENMIFNREVGGVFTLPSYTVLNAAVFYNVQKFSLNLKLNNLGDEEYYNGWSTINPQAPRNFAASFTYNF